jgi:hypothetical protein
MKTTVPTLTDIIKEYLLNNKYDGLCWVDGMCYCFVDNLMDCGRPYIWCQPAYRHEVGDNIIYCPIKNTCPDCPEKCEIYEVYRNEVQE